MFRFRSTSGHVVKEAGFDIGLRAGRPEPSGRMRVRKGRRSTGDEGPGRLLQSFDLHGDITVGNQDALLTMPEAWPCRDRADWLGIFRLIDFPTVLASVSPTAH